MHKLVLLRHGESTWNLENKFTGWTDVGLSPKGMDEALAAGRTLREEGFFFDVAYTSILKRAIKTLWVVLEEMDLMWIPVYRSWRLNERHYGALQGLNKLETVQKYGEEQVLVWRRSYDTPPPQLDPEDERSPRKNPKFCSVPDNLLPMTESLKDTVARFLPFWHETIAPALKAGQRPVIAAHGNSLRALVMYLDNLSQEAIVKLNIPTGIPLVYELDESLKPIRNYYLGDPEAVKRAVESVAKQTSAKK